LLQRYTRVRGTFGCSYRLVVVAYMMAAKYIHRNLRLVIPTTTLVDPQQPINNQSVTQQALRALRMEIEFLHFLQYDLTCYDPTSLVRWAHQEEEYSS
ncbi:hypothetical protein K492DRAFT_117510, partial [Lichtheimia hyalospora FSU 10163]